MFSLVWSISNDMNLLILLRDIDNTLQRLVKSKNSDVF
jgi:hypothetical protein